MPRRVNPDPNLNPNTNPNPNRRPFTIRDDLIAAFGEFVGTVVFLLFALGGIQAAASSIAATNGGVPSATAIPSVIQLLYISASMGLSLLVTVWFFFRATGGVFNPQISLALVLCRIITPLRFVLYVIAQLVGGIVAAAILQALLPGPLTVNCILRDGTNRAQGLFIEMFLTAALVFSVLMLATEKHRSTPFAPVGIGLTLFVGQLWGALFTGAAMNTARAFGPAVVTSFHNYHWIYWLGPTLGSLLATALYLFLRSVRYWELNPGQDNDYPIESAGAPLTGNRTDGNVGTRVNGRSSLDGGATVGRNSLNVGKGEKRTVGEEVA